MIYRFLIAWFFICCTNDMMGQACDESSMISFDVRAIETDPEIPWELAKHKTYFNPECVSRNLLLVHLVGSLDNPGSTTVFPSLAANCGFHVLVLKYPNLTAAQSACSQSEDTNCYEKFRLEIIEGYDLSDEVEVDSTNSILNRTSKLILHLQEEFPLYNWGQYLDQNGELLWEKMLFSGHSQGGGHAALIAKNYSIHRALMFASPNDYNYLNNEPAFWLQSASETDTDRFFGFNNVQDNVVEFQDQYDIWQDLFLSVYGDTVNVETTPYPYNETRQLIISRDTSGLAGSHSMMIIDEYLPTDGAGRPIYDDVLKYMLGVDIISSNDEISVTEPMLLYPNPASTNLKISQSMFEKGSVLLSILNTNLELVNQFYVSEFGNEINVDVSVLERGMYIMQIKSENEFCQSLRFVKL